MAFLGGLSTKLIAILYWKFLKELHVKVTLEYMESSQTKYSA